MLLLVKDKVYPPRSLNFLHEIKFSLNYFFITSK